MRPTIPWPHAPTHQLSNRGTYFVTAGTYLKAHYFYAPQRLDVLHRGLLSVARDFSWDLEAWAVFSNHYHFVAHSPRNSEKSYLARLNYVHQNAVKHGLVPVANQYQWCSARWFEQIGSPAMVRSIYRFKIDQLSIRDDFSPVLKPQPLLESAGAPAHSKTQARKDRSICRPRFRVRR
jgi:REP-associated tyrosine transposase